MKNKGMGLIGKSVVNDEGTYIGTIIDYHTDYETGLADSITVLPKPEPDKTKKQLQENEEETFESPCFTSVRDIVIVNEETKDKHCKSGLFR